MATTCNERMEVYSRVVGYFRPVQNWNPGKKQEFSERVVYNAEELINRESWPEKSPVVSEEVTAG